MQQMTSTPLANGVYETLASVFHGQIIRPGDADYDQGRAVWNGMIDRYPALIVRPIHVADVVTAVNFARDHQLAIAVRGGGHNVAGHATVDGGIVIDLSALKRIEVDVEARTARAGGGVTWGELDAATQQYGLATPGGVFTRTGIAGLTLGGGFGWLRNKFGLSADNLIGAEMVTADGRLVRASETENSDLLWGLRGGGGNFGIVTTFEYQLHPVGPEVMFVFVLHNGEGDNMEKALRFYRDFVQTAPDEVSTLAAPGVVPPGSAFPVEIQGRPFVLIGALYAGDSREGQRLLQPLRHFAQPLFDMSGIMPYVEAQKMFDTDYPDGMRYYWKSINLTRLDDDVIARIVDHAKRQPSAHSTTDLWHIGGAVSRVGADESAFFGRQAAFMLNPEANWEHEDEDEENIHWVREFVDAMAEFSDGSRYLNFAGFQEEGDDMMQTSFASQYERLARLKRQYDPNNLFRLNQNVKPADQNS